MASTTYRVIQDSEQIGTVTKEQVAKVIREFFAAQAKKSVAVKSSGASKQRRSRSKR